MIDYGGRPLSHAVPETDTGRSWGERSRVERGLVVGLVLAATFLVYLPTTRFGFVSDDVYLIVRNPFIQSWRFVPRYFTGHIWSYQYPHMLGNFYRPFFLLWLRLNHAGFGLAAWKWHLMSVMVHIATTFMVYWLARKILSDTFTAALAALIFGLHPTHIESVVYLTAVPEMVTALLVIASFLGYLRGREQAAPSVDRARASLAPIPSGLAGSLVLYSLSLLVKETAIVLPVLILAYEWIFPSRNDQGGASRLRRLWAAIRGPAPYLALTLVYLMVRVTVLKGVVHVVTPLPASTVVMTAPLLLAFYLRLLAWPVESSAFYDPPYVTHAGWGNFVLPAAAVVAAATALWAWSRRTRKPMGPGSSISEGRAIALASLWLFVPTLLVLNLQALPEGDVAHDRYLYLPSVGFSIIAALAVNHFNIGRARFFGQPRAKLGLALALAALLGLGTLGQSVYWANELSLYSHSYGIAPHNNSAATSLAAVAEARGFHSAAIKLYKQVLDRSPKFWRANVNLAYTYYELGQLEEAERYFTRSIEADPVDGNQYLFLGLTRMRLGRFEEAQGAIRRALEVRPGGPDYHFALGVILETQGKLGGAREEFKAELANHPNHAAAQAHIAEIEGRLNRRRPRKTAVAASDFPFPHVRP